MEKLKRWADYVCACAHFVWLPANSRSRQAEAKVFTIMCATEEKEKLFAFLFVKWRLGYHPRVDERRKRS
jgi:hypothetical protein